MNKTTSCKTEREALAIPPPTTITHIEHWHALDTYFGIRIMRARQDDGTVTRPWMARYHAADAITAGCLGGSMTPALRPWNCDERLVSSDVPASLYSASVRR